MTQGRDKRRDFVNAVKNLWVRIKCEKFLDQLSKCWLLRKPLLHGVRCESANHTAMINKTVVHSGNWKCVIPVVCVKAGKGVCSQTQLCQLRCFNDYTRQLHVSAPTGHLKVVFKTLSSLEDNLKMASRGRNM